MTTLRARSRHFVLSLVCAIPGAGAAKSSLNLREVMGGVENAASSGLVSVASWIASSNLPVLTGLYGGVFCGVLAIVVSVVRKPTLSSSAWLLPVGSALSIFAVLVLWKAESMLIAALPSTRDGIVAGASTIELLLTMSLISGLGSVLALLIGLIIGDDSGKARNWSPFAALFLVVALFVTVGIAFQLRNSWLYNLLDQASASLASGFIPMSSAPHFGQVCSIE